MLIPFEDEVISVANIQAQPPGQVFNVEAELSLASKDQRFSVLACSNCKQLFTRYNVRREIYGTSCHQSTHLIPRCQFEVTIKDNNGFATAIVSDEISEKMLHLTSEEIYEICFVKKQDVIHKPMASTTVNVTDAKKRTIEHLSSGGKRISKHGKQI
uniref:Replication factor A C-terminal domain-containing protein n=1 Tax=Solanum tuberosum TaxID=4113 RepID=M1C9D2_SOLTU